jgi:hypothetical protein
LALLSTKTGLPSFAAADNAIINYFTDGGFERGSNGVIPTGWAQYNDGASATPVDGTGGSAVAQVTMLCTTSSPIRGTLSAVISKDANNRQGVGYSFPFTISNADKGITAGVNFELLTSANYVSGDMVFYIYDATNSVLITPRSVSLPALPSYGKFFSDYGLTAGTSYRFILHIATTSALAYTVTLDTMVNTTTRVAVPGSVVAEFTYTTTGITSSGGGAVTAGTGGSTTDVLRWRKVGSSIEMLFSFYWGTAGTSFGTGTYYKFNLPNGLNLVTTGLSSQALGLARLYDSSAATFVDAVVTWNGVGSTFLVLSPLDGSNIDIGPTSPFTFANGDAMSALVTVPVAEWVGSGSNFGPGASVEYLSSSFSSFSAVRDAGGTLVPTTTPAGVIETISCGTQPWQNAMQASDSVRIEMQAGGGTNPWLPINGAEIEQLRFDGTNYIGLGLYFDGTNWRFARGKYMQGTATLWSGLTAGTRFRGVKARPDAPVGQVLASTDGREGLYKAGSAPGYVGGAITTAGYVGEVLGTIASGTGGAIYQTTTSTNIGTGAANIVTLTLNKGTYLVSGHTVFVGPAGGATNVALSWKINGTQVSNTWTQQTIGASSATTVPFVTIPLVITTDATPIQLSAVAGAATTSTNNFLFAVRIA